LEHTVKVVKRICKHRILQQVAVDNMQFGYVKGKRTTDAIFTARRSYASAVLGVLILSVRLLHACFVTNPKNLPAIFLYHMKEQSF